MRTLSWIKIKTAITAAIKWLPGTVIIRTGVGDRVTVEMSPYDLARGRITFHHKSAQPTTAAIGQRRAMWRKRR